MEDKDGVQAVSLHRLFALSLAVLAAGWWVIAPARPMPDEMVYTLWGLFGITGATKVVTAARGGGQ